MNNWYYDKNLCGWFLKSEILACEGHPFEYFIYKIGRKYNSTNIVSFNGKYIVETDTLAEMKSIIEDIDDAITRNTDAFKRRRK